MPEYKQIVLNKGHTANIMGVSVEAFSKWNVASEGKRNGQVYYDLKKVIAYKLETMKRDTKQTSLTEARIRIARSRAEKSELEVSIMKKEFVPLTAVTLIWSEQMTNIKTKLLALPTSISRELLSYKTQIKIQSKLSDHINLCLEELANYEPEENTSINFSERKESKKKSKTATKPNNKRVGRSKKKTK